MSGSSSVTIPGTNPSTPVTVSLGTGDVLHLAAQIGALLSSINGAGGISNTQVSAGNAIPAAPAVTSPTVTELMISGSAIGSTTIPSGYNYVVDANTSPNTITGTNIALITGTVGGTFNVSGQSTVAVQGSNGLVQATGLYLISTAPGSDTISAMGSGTVAGDTGSNVMFVSGGSNLVSSIGQDTVVSGVGITTVNSSGSQSLIFGSDQTNALLFAAISGSQTTVSTFAGDASVTVSGTQDLAVGGSALSNILVTGPSATLIGGTGAETVNSASNTVLFGGTGPINFVSGAGTSTIVGTSGGNESVAVGTGGVVFSAGSGNASTIISGPGITTIFGGANSIVNFAGNQSGAVLLGFAGNETLNASGSSTSNLFSAGVGGNVSLSGGSGADTMYAGMGSDTMAGGGGSNAFAFFVNATGGSQDYITDFGAGDSLYLIGYDSTQSASSLQNAAVAGPSGVTLTLSDSTKITFTNLTSASSLNGDILYAPKTS